MSTDPDGPRPFSREDLLAAYDGQLRRRVPHVWPVGVAYESDGEVVRIHYGTHGVVDHGALTVQELDELVHRQRAVFADRGEPIEWKAYGHDSPGLPSALLAAGFSAGWRRSLLIAPIDVLRSEISSSVHALEREPDREFGERAKQLAVLGEPHRVPLSQLEADGAQFADLSTLVLRTGDRIRGVGWAHHLTRTEFIEIGGLTSPLPEFLPYWAGWSRRGPQRYFGWEPPEARFMVAEADGTRRDMLIKAGFQEVSTVQSYHWTPPKAPPSTRPVTELLGDPEYKRIWDQVGAQLSFKPSVTDFPGIEEPAPSVTWRLDQRDTGLPLETLEERLTEILWRKLPAAVAAEDLYWLDWNHVGYRFDPRRVGGQGQPGWPGSAYPDGDYYLYVTGDLRLGTFGHPWEQTLCVFGAALLAEVEAEITDLLGPPLRRRR